MRTGQQRADARATAVSAGVGAPRVWRACGGRDARRGAAGVSSRLAGWLAARHQPAPAGCLHGGAGWGKGMSAMQRGLRCCCAEQRGRRGVGRAAVRRAARRRRPQQQQAARRCRTRVLILIRSGPTTVFFISAVLLCACVRWLGCERRCSADEMDPQRGAPARTTTTELWFQDIPARIAEVSY